MGDLTITAGVETLTITGATAGGRYRVLDADGKDVVTMVADDAGNAHLAFVPEGHQVLAGVDDLVNALSNGHTVTPGDYSVVDESTSATHGPVRVLDVGDLGDPSLYDQELVDGFQYVTVRDGIQLSVCVRFPNEDLYGPAPWPTLIEYSGYSPSNPDAPQPGTTIANLLGFAVVGVNMRGTGCSGGVFDVFSPAQSADGYDVVETVARQPWVLHHKVGMIGLSYPGISQLYVASTQPPSLAAITPLSVIDDLWRQQWPGGTYNSGFTRAWLVARDAETQVGGQAWDQARIEAGDTVAAANAAIRSQNFDFERFGRAIESFRSISAARRTGSFVHTINVPVYLSGSWQDEQTGSRFALMLESFTSAPITRFTMMNGHHPDGYSPMLILRWFEFLSFFVARRIPKVPDLVRMFAPLQFEEHFGFTAEFEPDRFTEFGDDFDAALAAYLAEPPVRLLFESGAGHEVVGATAHKYEVHAASFPPPGVFARRWYLDADAALSETAPTVEAVDSYEDDLGAGDAAYSGELLNDLNRFTQPQVPITWSRFADHHSAGYQTPPLEEALVIAGQGHVDLWLQPETDDTSAQITLTEIRPDGFEQRLQTGYHRPTHRVEDSARSNDLAVDYTFTPEDREPLVPGEWIHFRVPIYPVTHVVRAGSALRVAISTPGRDHPFWNFESPVVEGARHLVGRGGAHASSLVLPVWADHGIDYPDEYPPAGSLRGQPVRAIEPIVNVSAR